MSQLRKLAVQLKSQAHIHIEHMDIEEIPALLHERGFQVRGYS